MLHWVFDKYGSSDLRGIQDLPRSKIEPFGTIVSVKNISSSDVGTCPGSSSVLYFKWKSAITFNKIKAIFETLQTFKNQTSKSHSRDKSGLSEVLLTQVIF